MNYDAACNCALHHGGTFANGAVTGAFGYLFNHALHQARVRITLGYTDTPIGVGNHALVIGTDPVSGEQYATRRGPTLNENGGCAIRAEAGVYDATFRDNPAQVHTLQEAGTLTVSLEVSASRANEFANLTNANRVGYAGVTSNSNSYAFTFVESLGFARPTPAVSAPGWRAGTPSPELSWR